MRLTTLHESLIGDWTGGKRLWMSGPEGAILAAESREPGRLPARL